MNTPADKRDYILLEFQELEQKILKEIYQMCWFMRGSITRSEAFEMGFLERKVVWEIINENIKRTNETGLPLV